MVYVNGLPDHRLKDADIVDHLVDADREEGGRDRGGARRSRPTPAVGAQTWDSFHSSTRCSRFAAPTTSCPTRCAATARVVETARAASARLYGYQEMATPIFEFSEVFKRTLGDTSDIVTKEMYTFTDRGGEQMTLRPENTAGVARALISGGLSAAPAAEVFLQPGRCSATSGRRRAACASSTRPASSCSASPQPQGDIEIIACGAAILRGLGCSIARCSSSTRWATARAAPPIARAWSIISPRIGTRCPRTAGERLERNPLRILDSKDEGDRAHRRRGAAASAIT